MKDEEYHRKAPDGGWGWVVVFSTSIAFSLRSVLFCVGVAFSSLIEDLNCTTLQLGAIASLCFSIQCLFAPVVSIINDYFGPRIVSFTGCFFIGLSLILSGFATHIIHLVLSYGFLGGIGMALNFMPPMILLSDYFDKKLSLAASLTYVGTYTGCFFQPYLLRFFIELYDWRWALILSGALAWNSLWASLLLRPLEAAPTAEPESVEIEVETESTTHKPKFQRFLSEPGKSPAINRRERTLSMLSQRKKIEHKSHGQINSATPADLHSKYFLSNLFTTQSGVDVSVLQSTMLWPPDSETKDDGVISVYIKLLKNSKFIAFVITNFFICMILWLPSVYSVDWGTTIGLDKDATTAILSAVGLSSLLFRPLVAVIADRFYRYRSWIVAILVAFPGVVSLFLPFFVNWYVLAIIVFIFTIFIGGTQTFLTPVLVDLVPKRLISPAFGVLLFGEGIGLLSGPPLLGLLPSYELTFCIAGVVSLAATASMLYVVIKLWQEQSQPINPAATV